MNTESTAVISRNITEILSGAYRGSWAIMTRGLLPLYFNKTLLLSRKLAIIAQRCLHVFFLTIRV